MPLDPLQRKNPTAVAGGARADHSYRGDLLTQRLEHLRFPAEGQDRKGELGPGRLEEGLATVAQQDATGIRVRESRGDRWSGPSDRGTQGQVRGLTDGQGQVGIVDALGRGVVVDARRVPGR